MVRTYDDKKKTQNIFGEMNMTPDKFADRYTLLVKVSSYFVNITLTKKFARQRLLITLYKVGNKRE